MVTVFGLGFVGLTTALGFAHMGYRVYGIDVDEQRKETLRSGKLPFLEPDMEEELGRHLGRELIITDDVKAAVADSDYIFYCVGTPYGEAGSADLTYLFSAIDTTVQAVQDDRFRVLVTKSTIPPSTTAEKIVPYVQGKGRIAEQLGIANNPEFLREGHCWEDFLGADRIVLGCMDSRSADMLTRLYEPMGIPIFCVSHATGEFIKYLSNTLLATMISYANEMAQMADCIGGIDVADAFRILHMDKRWNGCMMSGYVYPGCGYGGYCLPKDTCALLAQSEAKGYEPMILKHVIQMNEQRPSVIADNIASGLEKDAVIGILGLSFKPESDDVRDTPAAKIIQKLTQMGFHAFAAYDPVAAEEFQKHYPQLPVTIKQSAGEVYEAADVIAIATAWEEFRAVPAMGDKRVVDCRYMLGKTENNKLENNKTENNKLEKNKLEKNQIFDLVRQYYEQHHQTKPFKPGDRINYAGRVYDEQELCNLVDAALDFWLTAGTYTQEFETGLADYLHVPYCSAVNSGSSANLLAVMALTSPLLGERRLKKGDEVITVAAAFPTTVAPIIQCGAVPVFVDIGIPSYNADPSLLEAACSEKTKAVFLAHSLGNIFDLEAVKKLCERHRLWLIEDNCDALGGTCEIDGKTCLTGTVGDIGTSSFYPAHQMTMGEGGAVYTSNPLIHKAVRSLRDWGRECVCSGGQDNLCGHRFDGQYGTLPKGYDHKYVYSHLGYNLKITDLQAAIGVAQLKKLPDFVKKRQENWEYLHGLLQDLSDVLILPEKNTGCHPCWFGFILSVKEGCKAARSQITAYLEQHNIQTRNLFAGNILRHPCFEAYTQGTDYRVSGNLEKTDFAMNHSFWVGVYPGMTKEMLDEMAERIHEAVRTPDSGM